MLSSPSLMNYRSILFLTSLQTLGFLSTLEAKEIQSVVIGTNASSIIETLSTNTQPSLYPINSSILPLESTQTPISLPITNDFQAWINVIGKKITVVHRARDLQYQGILNKVNDDYFTLQDKQKTIRLVTNDFYLLHEKQSITDAQNVTFSGKVNYLSHELLWQPQLSLLINETTITLIQNANITNLSANNLKIDGSILQLRQQIAEQQQPERNLALLSAKTMHDTRYDNSETTVPLKGTVHLLAHSNTLTPLSTQTVKIEERTLISSINTYSNFLGSQSLSFEQTLTAKLDRDALPGHYKTFWQEAGYLIPSETIQLDHLRQGSTISIKPNKSLDVIGKLTLLNSSSRKLPSKQTWQLDLENHSLATHNIEVMHQLNAVIQSIQALTKQSNNENNKKDDIRSSKVSADTHKIQTTIAPKEKTQIQYTITLIE